MKEIIDKNLLYSKKGFLIIVFLVCLIAMPICEYYFGLEFSTVFPIVITDTWFVIKAIFYDREDKRKILFDILFSVVVTAGCLYFL